MCERLYEHDRPDLVPARRISSPSGGLGERGRARDLLEDVLAMSKHAKRAEFDHPPAAA
jgi:hypothetical protein